nr:hypothetical protein [uncultured bacterium]
MDKEEELFNQIGEGLSDAEKGQLFGKPCFKVNGKAYVCLFQNEMVFKLDGSAHDTAMSLDGSQLFDPSGKGRPMKQWVQVPFEYNELWPKFAKRSMEFVLG